MKYFKKPTFVVWFVLFSFIFYFFFSASTFSFSWLAFWSSEQNLKLSENYIREDLVWDDAVELALANISFGKWIYSSSHYIDKSLSNIKSTKNLVNTDIVQLLDWRSEKRQILESYIWQMRNLVHNNKDSIEIIRWKAQENMLDSQSCDSEKKYWDNLFYQWLKQQDSYMLKEWLDISSESWPCYIEHRVKYNAFKAIDEKLTFYNSILERKLFVIENNSHEIVENFQLFKTNKLEQLTSLRNELRSFSVN